MNLKNPFSNGGFFWATDTLFGYLEVTKFDEWMNKLWPNKIVHGLTVKKLLLVIDSNQNSCFRPICFCSKIVANLN